MMKIKKDPKTGRMLPLYSQEFKEHALRVYKQYGNSVLASKKLGISYQAFFKWGADLYKKNSVLYPLLPMIKEVAPLFYKRDKRSKKA